MIAPRNKFKNQRSYNRYLYAVKLGIKLNNYLKKGYWVFHEEDLVKEIVFCSNLEYDPVIAIKEGTWLYDLLPECFYDDHGFEMQHTQKEIKEIFSKFSMLHPKYIKKFRG